MQMYKNIFAKLPLCMEFVVSLQLEFSWKDLIDCNHKKKC